MEVIFECDSKIVSDALLGLCTPPMIISNFMHFLQIPPKYIYINLQFWKTQISIQKLKKILIWI